MDDLSLCRVLCGHASVARRASHGATAVVRTGTLYIYEANRAASASTGSRLNVCCACKPPRACLRRRDKRPARRLLLCFALVTLAAAATALGRLAGHWTVKIKARSHSVCQHLVLPPPPPCFNYWAGHPRLACSQPSALPAKVSIAPHGPQHRSLR